MRQIIYHLNPLLFLAESAGLLSSLQAGTVTVSARAFDWLDVLAFCFEDAATTCEEVTVTFLLYVVVFLMLLRGGWTSGLHSEYVV